MSLAAPAVRGAAPSGDPRAASGGTAAGADRARELDALRAFAERTHPRGREAAADADWQARWSAAAAATTDGDYLVRTRRALAWFGDGHTTLLPFEFAGGVPAALAHGPLGLELP